MMARRFQCERRPSYSTLKESMNSRHYSDPFFRQFVAIVTAQRITEKKIVVLFLSFDVLMFERTFHSCNLDPRSSELLLDVCVVCTRQFNSA
jgi:hypothetical protein